MVENHESLNDKIQLADLTPDNIDIYKEIRLRALRDEPQAFGSTLAREEAFTEDKWLARTREPFNVIAIEGDRPVGTMGAFVTEEEKGKIAHLVGVFVIEEARRRGVGSKLLDRVLSKIRSTEHGISKVELSVSKEQTAAIKLYEKFGFDVTGENKTVLGDGKEHEEVIMSLQL